MGFDLYTGIVSCKMVTALVPPLWAEQRRYHSNPAMSIINVFAEVQHEKSPLFSLLLWWWKRAAGCGWLSWLCWRSLFLPAQQKCCQGRLLLGWPSPCLLVSCPLSQHGSEKKDKILTATRTKSRMGKCEPGQKLLWSLVRSCKLVTVHVRLVSCSCEVQELLSSLPTGLQSSLHFS